VNLEAHTDQGTVVSAVSADEISDGTGDTCW